jgi:hypothetical protein
MSAHAPSTYTRAKNNSVERRKENGETKRSPEASKLAISKNIEYNIS